MRAILIFWGLFCASLTYAQSFNFTQSPIMSDATATSITLSWKASKNATEGTIYWGNQPNNLTNTLSINPADSSFTIPNLSPATVYYIRLKLTHQSTVIQSDTQPYITSSTSSGEMKVYFNYSVNSSFSNGSIPEATSSTDLETNIVNQILAATSTIDICMYNVNRNTYIYALKQVASQGVTVRYIAESDRTNYSLHNNTLNFPVLYADASGIMHDKFLIIDRDLPEKATVVMGSYNFTNSNLYQGYNNMISIQDQSLAEIYTLEFEEMWGSSEDQPSLSTSRIGNAKTDNTPHTVFINGTKVESYFSPSDHTTSHIIDAIQTADTDLRFGLLAFTNNDLENAIFDLSIPVKGLIEEQYNGTETAQFQAKGFSIYDFEESGHFLHHKYGIVDAQSPDSDPILITGSHNWTYSAEKYNDENTLIIHDADIANIFLQEFEARWKTIVAIEKVNNHPQIRIYPNPARKIIHLQNNMTTLQTVSIINCLGKQMSQQVLQPNEQKTLDIRDFPEGIYFLLLSQNQGITASEKLLITH